MSPGTTSSEVIAFAPPITPASANAVPAATSATTNVNPNSNEPLPKTYVTVPKSDSTSNPTSSSDAPMDVWMICDRDASKSMRESLMYHNCKTRVIDLHDFRSSTFRTSLLNETLSNAPAVIWIHVADLKHCQC